MRLDAITTEPRPRNPWEASDLGAVMIRRWWRPVYASWFAVTLPLFLLLHLACWGNWWLVPWLLWWLKPLIDRIPLYILSRTLFGELPDRRQFWQDFLGLMRCQIFASLLWRRFDSVRSFSLPVSQLEGLSGKARRQRLRDLNARGQGSAIWLTVICLHLEIALDFAVISLVWMLIPDFVMLDFSDLIDGSDELGQLWINVVGFCGLSLIEPFYVAAGFSLYLNRRTWLEAWDLEIGFRRIAARLTQIGKAVAMLVLVVGLGLLALPAISIAADAVDPAPTVKALPNKTLCQKHRERQNELAQSDSQIKRALAETLQEPELQVCEQQEQWRWRKTSSKIKSDRSEGEYKAFAEGFATVVELLLWFAFAAFIVITVWWLWKHSSRLQLPNIKRRTKIPRPSIHQGQNPVITPPDKHLATDAWQLWMNGQTREALQQLYQGSLTGLATHHALPIHTSVTEDECLRLVVTQLNDSELIGFFCRLTRAWQATAYAHRPPDDASAKRLCEEWSRHFTTVGELSA